jgi:pyruvate dehydrogenase E1 component beta subunit
MVKQSLAAANIASEEFGIDCEIVDPRTLKPLDEELIYESVRKTNRVVIAEEGHEFAGVGAQIADFIQRNCFDYLDAPIERVTSLDIPMPYAENLEDIVLPRPPKIVQAIRKVCYQE